MESVEKEAYKDGATSSLTNDPPQPPGYHNPLIISEVEQANWIILFLHPPVLHSLTVTVIPINVKNEAATSRSRHRVAAAD